MKNALWTAVIALMALGTTSATHPARSMVKVENNDVAFKIVNIDDGALYEVTYTVDGVRCHITVDGQTEVQRMIFGDEMYPIKYVATAGSLTYPTIQAPVPTPSGGGGNQYIPWACDDCQDTVDFLAPMLYYALCPRLIFGSRLKDPDGLLSETATAAIAVFCDGFKPTGGNPLYGDVVCEGQCEPGDPNCVRPLEMTLEWEGFGDLYLQVIEPVDHLDGFRHYSAEPDLGRLVPTGSWSYVSVIYGWEDGFGSGITTLDDYDTEDLGPRSLTYYLVRGLSPDEAVGDYEVWVEVGRSGAPISWKLTVEVNGEQVRSESGEFGEYPVWQTVRPPPAPVSEPFTVTLDEYIDNGCSNTVY